MGEHWKNLSTSHWWLLESQSNKAQLKWHTLELAWNMTELHDHLIQQVTYRTMCLWKLCIHSSVNTPSSLSRSQWVWSLSWEHWASGGNKPQIGPISHTQRHTYIHTKWQFRVTSPPTGMFLGGKPRSQRKPIWTRDNMKKLHTKGNTISGAATPQCQPKPTSTYKNLTVTWQNLRYTL